jgi:type IV secretion system protein VirB11
MHDMTPDREESIRRKLEDLEDAYGSAIRRAKTTEGCTDFYVNEDGSIWTKINGVQAPTGEFLTAHAARRICNLVSDIDGNPIENATLNANLPTGERFAAFLPPLVKGISFSVRLPPSRIYTLEEYVSAGIMTEQQADKLRQAVEARKNILVAGGTNAGKTTLANALLAETAFTQSRTCIAQDQNELQCRGRNVVRVFTKTKHIGAIIREFLRHDPSRIVVGEIRDGYAAGEWVEGCNTGHPGGLSTTHANSAEKGLTRIASLIGKIVVNVDHTEIASAIELVAFIREEKDGKRRLAEIAIPTGWDGRKFLTEPA